MTAAAARHQATQDILAALHAAGPAGLLTARLRTQLDIPRDRAATLLADLQADGKITVTGSTSNRRAFLIEHALTESDAATPPATPQPSPWQAPRKHHPIAIDGTLHTLGPGDVVHVTPAATDRLTLPEAAPTPARPTAQTYTDLANGATLGPGAVVHINPDGTGHLTLPEAAPPLIRPTIPTPHERAITRAVTLAHIAISTAAAGEPEMARLIADKAIDRFRTTLLVAIAPPRA